MKLSCTQENLASALFLVAPISAKGGSLPILSNILLSAQDGVLKISATNLEIGVTSLVRGKIIEEGSFTVSGKLFFEYVNLLSSDTVSLYLDGEHLRISAGTQQTKINGQAPEEFPVIPSIDGSVKYIVDARSFKEAASQVLFAISPNDARPEIAGMLMSFEGKTLTLVGTDSYRLAERKTELSSGADQKKDAIIPLRTTQELIRILGQSEGDLVISLSENQVLFSVAEVELISRVILGSFPDYKQIIPSKSSTKVLLDKDTISRAIKSASLFCRQGLNHVSFQFSYNKILVSASASQVGENTIEVPAKVEGKDVDIVFDYRYVLEGLGAMRSGEVEINLEGNSSPGVFKPKDKANYLYLVMPIKQ